MSSLQKHPMGGVLPTEAQTSQGMFMLCNSIQGVDLWWQNQYTTIHFEKNWDNRWVHLKTLIKKNKVHLLLWKQCEQILSRYLHFFPTIFFNDDKWPFIRCLYLNPKLFTHSPCPFFSFSSFFSSHPQPSSLKCSVCLTWRPSLPACWAGSVAVWKAMRWRPSPTCLAFVRGPGCWFW